MEELLFQASIIWWEGAPWGKGIFQAMFLIILGVLGIGVMRLFYKKNKNFKKKGETFSLIFPTKEEDNFEEKLLDRLKDYIEHSHAPKHSSSHTVREISSYLSYQELLVEIQNLEDTLYQGKVLTIDERTYLLKKLTTLTVNNTLLTDL